MEQFLLPLFMLNLLLVLIDASVGYHLAPLLYNAAGGEEEDALKGVGKIRRMLKFMVALYMFFNCFAYFNYNHSLLMVVTVLVLLDLGGQLYVRHRIRVHQNDELED
jgi:hypothetical protein